MTYSKWTQQRIKLLRKYHEQGFSAAEIAEIFGTSSNAISIALSRNNILDKPKKLPPRARVQFGYDGGESICRDNMDVFEVVSEMKELFKKHPLNPLKKDKSKSVIRVVVRMEYKSDKFNKSKSFSLYGITPKAARDYYKSMI